MRTLFDELDKRIDQAGAEAQLMRRLLRKAYRHFEKQHHFKKVHPSMLSIVRFQVELSLLDQEAEIFRNSPHHADGTALRHPALLRYDSVARPHHEPGA